MLRAAVLALVLAPALAGAAAPLLIQQPALGRHEIVFVFAGDLWTVPRTGGEARRLTSGIGVESWPRVSPDGQWVAFTGEYDGNVDVFVMPISGGIPRRLTASPEFDGAVGWTPDSRQVLFASTRDSANPQPRLFTVPVTGGLATPLPLPRGVEGSYSADGRSLVYVPHPQWQAAWKRYRGGQTTPLWIASLADSSTVKIPRENSNDFNPMWVQDRIFFLSDRGGRVGLYVYDTKAKTVALALASTGFDFKSASAASDAIVVEEFGALHLYDLATSQARNVEVTVAGDLPEVRPRRMTVDAKRIQNMALSPTGARAAFEARGEILTVPAEKGDARNLTRTPGVAEREPAWSPDGQRLAYFSEAGGEYGLEIRDQKGLGEPRRVSLGTPPSFYYRPVFSPDGHKVAYEDQRLGLFYVDVDKGGPPVKVDTNLFAFSQPFEPTWSSDSRYLAYTKDLPTRIRAAFIHSVAEGKSRALTDGMADVLHPRFDRGGAYLYFTASIDIGPANSMGDLSQMRRPVTRSAYVVVLRADGASPLAPESDEEKTPDADDAKGSGKGTGKPAGKANEKDKGKDKEKDVAEPSDVRIDWAGLGDRILPLPVPARNYTALDAGKEGVLYLVEAPVVDLEARPDGTPLSIHRFSFESRKTEKILDEVTAFVVSANGEKALVRKGSDFQIVSIGDTSAEGGESAKASSKPPLKLATLEVPVDPRAEWRQMYHEAWRIERDFFYDPGHHGLDLAATEKTYAPFVEGLGSRADLNALFVEMLGEMTVGHMFVAGGDQPEPKRVKGGLLGADYRIENGRYRLDRMYSTEGWDPRIRAVLGGPGVSGKAGEYILSVNGRELTAADDLDAVLEGTADQAVVLRLGPSPDGKGAREATVVPLASEAALRHDAWVEGNRRKVLELSGGKVAYLHLPDTAEGAMKNFNRYFFAQTDKQAVVVDERSNGGGYLADYVVDFLGRKPLSRVATREGADRTSPEGAIYGPKVMIIDESAGSGGDAMPWYFRKAGLGKLVGKRTWGGLVGFAGNVPLLDGGFVAAPRAAIYGLTGDWEVENIGVAPDVEVELDPKAWREGHDAQLEKAVAVVLEELERTPPPTFKRPAYPNYHPRSD